MRGCGGPKRVRAQRRCARLVHHPDDTHPVSGGVRGLPVGVRPRVQHRTRGHRVGGGAVAAGRDQRPVLQLPDDFTDSRSHSITVWGSLHMTAATPTAADTPTGHTGAMSGVESVSVRPVLARTSLAGFDRPGRTAPRARYGPKSPVARGRAASHAATSLSFHLTERLVTLMGVGNASEVSRIIL